MPEAQFDVKDYLDGGSKKFNGKDYADLKGLTTEQIKNIALARIASRNEEAVTIGLDQKGAHQVIEMINPFDKRVRPPAAPAAGSGAPSIMPSTPEGLWQAKGEIEKSYSGKSYSLNGKPATFENVNAVTGSITLRIKASDTAVYQVKVDKTPSGYKLLPFGAIVDVSEGADGKISLSTVAAAPQVPTSPEIIILSNSIPEKVKKFGVTEEMLGKLSKYGLVANYGGEFRSGGAAGNERVDITATGGRYLSYITDKGDISGTSGISLTSDAKNTPSFTTVEIQEVKKDGKDMLYIRLANKGQEFVHYIGQGGTRESIQALAKTEPAKLTAEGLPDKTQVNTELLKKSGLKAGDTVRISDIFRKDITTTITGPHPFKEGYVLLGNNQDYPIDQLPKPTEGSTQNNIIGATGAAIGSAMNKIGNAIQGATAPDTPPPATQAPPVDPAVPSIQRSATEPVPGTYTPYPADKIGDFVKTLPKENGVLGRFFDSMKYPTIKGESLDETSKNFSKVIENMALVTGLDSKELDKYMRGGGSTLTPESIEKTLNAEKESKGRIVSSAEFGQLILATKQPVFDSKNALYREGANFNQFLGVLDKVYGTKHQTVDRFQRR